MRPETPIIRTLRASPFPMTPSKIHARLSDLFSYDEMFLNLNRLVKDGRVICHGETIQGKMLYGVKK